MQVQINQMRTQVKQSKADKSGLGSATDQFVLEKLDDKANIKDVAVLIDAKADSDEVFEVLDEMKKSLTLLSSKVD